jgi:hypothetical protein
MHNCEQRSQPLEAQLKWDIKNIWEDAKHGKNG